MKVKVRVFGELRFYVSQRCSSFEVEVPAGYTFGQLLAWIGIPPVEAWVLAVNGERVWTDRILEDGDEVTVSGPVAGG